jgi:ATP-dependent Clp protease ATP-binding subunit ClpC
MFERFTEKAIKVVMLSQEEARRLHRNYVSTEQLFLGVIGEGTGLGYKVARQAKFNLKETRILVECTSGWGRTDGGPGEIPFSPRAKRVLEHSIEESRDLGHGYVGTEHLLLAILDEDDGGPTAKVFEDKGVIMSRLKIDLLVAIGAEEEKTEKNRETYVDGEESEEGSLEDFSTNLTDDARTGKLDPVVGRVKEIERVVQILVRRKKNNPILIGEPGVGKTAVAEGLAQRIVQRDVPDILEDREIISLDIGLLLAGTKFRGEFEERIKIVMEEVEARPEVILVIDEVHNLIGAGAAEGAVDAANILKPALARGGLQCIGATTIEEYRKHIEKDAALERRFQPVTVPEPTIEETIEILRGLRSRYEKHHFLKYSDESLVAAAKYSSQFIADRFLPDKAIDLLDEAGARVRLLGSALSTVVKEHDKELRCILEDKEVAIRGNDFKEAIVCLAMEVEMRRVISGIMTRESGEEKKYNPTVRESDIADIVAAWTGIPVTKVARDEKDKLINIETTLHEKVIGQDVAVSAIAKAIRRARVGLKNPNRPIASFIFSGPTGVGKTELTKVLASYFFGSADSMVRIDMSEFMERHSVAKLIGSPPGYVGFSEGGLLTEEIRRKPYSVVLFDEAEKAHPDIFNILLQILEDGRLTDAQGKLIDFRNTLLILTSNIGSADIIPKSSNDTPENDEKVDGSKAIEESIRLKKEEEEKEKLKKEKEEKEKEEKLKKEKEANKDKTKNDDDLTPEELEAIFNLGYDFAEELKNCTLVEGDIKEEEPMDPEYAKIYKSVNEALKGFFRPEFLNRLDEIIVFKPLTIEDVGKIALIMLNQLSERVEEQGYTIEVDDLAKDILIKEGFDPIYGARPLRRAIMNLLEDKLAELFLTVDIKPGNHVHVTASNNRIKLKVEDASPEKQLIEEEDLERQRLEFEKNPPQRKFKYINREDYGKVYAVPEKPESESILTLNYDFPPIIDGWDSE